jgi:hypothetical protein
VFFGNRNVQIIQIEANVQWEVAFDPDAKVYMGVCRALNLNAIGDTWIEFQECANDALNALLLDLFRSGEFEGFMRTHGWRPSSVPVPGSTPRFDVPFMMQKTKMQELVAS